jgi:predicted PolB exonuclease-like 3'-5' exonuclease
MAASHQNLLVVDIETVPDRKHHEGDGFPKPPFHQVVAIGFLSAQISRDGDAERFTLRELRCGGESRSSEAELVASFFGYIERLKPRIVTFNGRAFDFPVLKYRAMLHGVSAPAFHRSEGRF